MKKILALLLAALLLAGVMATGAAAADTKDIKPIADALHSLGLFLGTGDVDGVPNYALDGTLTRAHGVILLVRLLGKEAQALNGTYSHPFTDTRSWYDKHVGYAYTTGLTNGTGKDTYSGDLSMTAEMFTTFCLRALGYDDGAGDFDWKKAPEFAAKLGITVDTQDKYLRGDAVMTFWTALNTRMKGQTTTLADKLIAEGVFTRAAFEQAQKIAAGSSAGGNELPDTPITETESGSTQPDPNPTTPPYNPSEGIRLPEIEL